MKCNDAPSPCGSLPTESAYPEFRNLIQTDPDRNDDDLLCYILVKGGRKGAVCVCVCGSCTMVDA